MTKGLLITLALWILPACEVEEIDISDFFHNDDDSQDDSDRGGDTSATDDTDWTAEFDTEIPETCGDGILDEAEACDDGNLDDGDGCSADCRYIEEDWACPVDGELCVATGTVTGECGDGVVDVEAGELCDDGNTVDGDGCSADCAELEPGWVCDPAVGVCEGVCGDGIIQGKEECDDGVNSGEYGACAPDCMLGPHCGDGILQPDFEQCDDGVNDGEGDCAPGCML